MKKRLTEPLLTAACVCAHSIFIFFIVVEPLKPGQVICFCFWNPNSSHAICPKYESFLTNPPHVIRATYIYLGRLLHAHDFLIFCCALAVHSAVQGDARKSGQGPNGAPTGRVFAVGISFSEGETGRRPVPPTL